VWVPIINVIVVGKASRMLGWHISVFKQRNDGASPATAESEHGTRLAVWQTGLGGLDWLEELLKAGKAISLGGTGYPCRYTATAEYLLPRIIETPPGARTVWVCQAGDIIADKWEGRTVVDREAATHCRPNEWLLVEAWDES
jgi:hypothetical protein